MPEAPLRFGIQESGDEEFAGAPPVAQNVLIDGAGAIRRRPGIATFGEFPSTAISSYAVSGIYRTLTGAYFAVDQTPGRRRIYRLTTGSALDITGTLGPQDLAGTKRPTFAETEALLAIAGGREVQKLKLLEAGTPSSRLGGNPPRATHIIAQSSSFLVNRVDSPLQDVHYSDPGTGTAITPFETWSGTISSGNFRVNLTEDPVVAIARTMTEVWAFCATSTELWVPDPAQAFARTTPFERGCVAPYSVIDHDEAKAWIDDDKQMVMAMGRAEKIISPPIQNTLDSVTGIEEAFGFRYKEDQFDAMCWSMPSDGRTFCFAGGWSQWLGYDNGPVQFLVNCHHRDRKTKDNLVGLTDGRVGKLTTAASDDLGNPIKALVRTGYDSRGTQNRKTCKGIRLSFRRDTLDTTQTPTALFRYRDEDGMWRGEIPLVIDRQQKVIRLRSLGSYRRRQYEVEWDAGENVTLADATEDYEVQAD